jgi:Na+/melibiose symporter-like transporter
LFNAVHVHLAKDAVLVSACVGVAIREIRLRCAIWGIGSDGALLMSTLMLPDASESNRPVGGKRREGMISGISSITERPGFAIAPVVMGCGFGPCSCGSWPVLVTGDV